MMNRLQQLAKLEGHWQGLNQLWLSPNDPVRESETAVSVTNTGQGNFVTLAYTWADAGKPQDGLLLVGQADEGIQAVWVDSWHMGKQMMLCHGEVTANGGVSVRGSYAAPPDPDWGWRIDVEPEENGRFRLLMYNITPHGEEMLAVTAVYTR